MNIEIGEYIRTKNGEIRKVVEYVVGGYLVDTSYYNEIIKENTLGIIPLEDVKKHTKNIIELVEVGDYVNGYKVVEIDEYKPIGSTLQKYLKVDCSKLFNAIYSEQIKTILTKEQYKANCYKVEE